jgi:hypothetical protein
MDMRTEDYWVEKDPLLVPPYRIVGTAVVNGDGIRLVTVAPGLGASAEVVLARIARCLEVCEIVPLPEDRNPIEIGEGDDFLGTSIG